MAGLMDFLGRALCYVLAVCTAAGAVAFVILAEIEKYKDERKAENRP